jgi:electron transfer flavoprotein beta subunit
MNIIVCVKRVPDTAEAEVVIDEEKKDIKKADLPFDINEWDNYAIEEAIQLKEKLGGTVAAVTIGSKEDEEVLRRCLAMGADAAIRLSDDAFEGSDGYAISRILHGAIKGMEFDLVFTGVQASDDGYAQVGVTLAQMLNVPHAAMVSNIEEIDGGNAKVHQELEGGLENVIEIKLPAVFTIQSGINEPRYVSIMGIRKASKKEIIIRGLGDIGLDRGEVGEAGSKTTIERIFIPPVEKIAEILKGDPSETSARLGDIFKERGLI